MAAVKELKRITLFPKDDQFLTQERLMSYIVPMGDLKFLPAAKKGLSLKAVPSGELKVVESWAVDFTNVDDGVKVSVTVDRIDILCEGETDWQHFFDQAEKIIKIVLQNNPLGIARVAVGYASTRYMAENEVRPLLGEGKEETDLRKFKEKTDKIVLVDALKDAEGKEVLKYNDVHTIIVSAGHDGWTLSDDYDINTVVGSDEGTVTSNMSLFLTVGIGKLSSLAQSKEG